MGKVVRVTFSVLPGDRNTNKALDRSAPGASVVYRKKDASGRERSYVMGISSGTLMDAHNENMSKSCVEDFNKQATTATIFLLHPHTDNLIANNIGKLDESYITESGEWATIYRAWDDYDKESGTVPLQNIENAKAFIAMQEGAEPYGKTSVLRQLSIQGLVNTDDITENKDNGSRTINKLELDGVAAVTRGAYPQKNISTMRKVFKSIEEGISKGELEDEMVEQEFVREFWDTEGALHCVIREIVDSKDDVAKKKARIVEALDEFKAKVIALNLEEGEMAEPATNNTVAPKADPAPAGDGKPEDSSTATPEEKGGADVAALQEQMSQMSQMLAQMQETIAALGGGGDAGGDAAAAAAASKATPGVADLGMEEPNVSEEKKKRLKAISDNLAAIGMTKTQIDQQLKAISVSTDPNAKIAASIAALDAKVDTMNKSFADMIQDLATFTVLPAGEKTLKDAPNGGTGATESGVPEHVLKFLADPKNVVPADVKAWLEKHKSEVDAAKDVTPQAQLPGGVHKMPSVQDFAKSLTGKR